MIAEDQLVDALTDLDMRLRIQQLLPKSLNDAVRMAFEIEVFCMAERQRRHDVGFVRIVFSESDRSLGGDTNLRDDLKQLRDELRTSIQQLEKSYIISW